MITGAIAIDGSVVAHGGDDLADRGIHQRGCSDDHGGYRLVATGKRAHSGGRVRVGPDVVLSSFDTRFVKLRREAAAIGAAGSPIHRHVVCHAPSLPDGPHGGGDGRPVSCKASGTHPVPGTSRMRAPRVAFISVRVLLPAFATHRSDPSSASALGARKWKASLVLHIIQMLSPESA